MRLLTPRSRRSERARAGWQRARCLPSHTALFTGDQQPKIQLVYYKIFILNVICISILWFQMMSDAVNADVGDMTQCLHGAG